MVPYIHMNASTGVNSGPLVGTAVRHPTFAIISETREQNTASFAPLKPKVRDQLYALGQFRYSQRMLEWMEVQIWSCVDQAILITDYLRHVRSHI